MLKLTNTQFVNRLKRIDGCTFVSLRAVVRPTMRTTGNPYAGRVLKVVSAAGVLNFRYSRVVNLQRIREARPADFVAKPRQWGEHLNDRPIIRHVDDAGRVSYYLDIKIQSRTDQFRLIDSGAVVTRDQLEEWLPAYPKTRQELTKKVAMRDFRIEHIAELRINGELWQIRSGFARLTRLLKPKAKT